MTFPSQPIHQQLKSSKSTATARYSKHFAKSNMRECNMIAFFHYVNFPLSTRRFFKPISPFFFTQQRNTRENYSTEQQRHMNRAFFRPWAQKNRIYASNYPASERMKFVCAVNVYARGTVVGYKFWLSETFGSLEPNLPRIEARKRLWMEVLTEAT